MTPPPHLLLCSELDVNMVYMGRYGVVVKKKNSLGTHSGDCVDLWSFFGAGWRRRSCLAFMLKASREALFMLVPNDLRALPNQSVVGAVQGLF